MSEARTGVQVRCTGMAKSGFCIRYDGKLSGAPKRVKCAYCGGKLVHTATVWGAVEWNVEGRYERPEIVFCSPELALAACTDGQVDRPFMVSA